MVRAFAVKAPSQPLEPFDYTSPELHPTDVEVNIDYCGLCYSDVHLIDNDWDTSNYPLVPGHEIVGKIARKGEMVQGVDLQQTVGIGWQCSACFHCEFCVRGDDTFCLAKKRTCVDRYGGFSDKIIVDYRFVYPIPTQIPPQEAAPLLCGGITVYSPLRLHQIQPPMSVAILGIGGLGHLGVQFARAFGCSVTAISTSLSKEEEAKQLGAHFFLPLDQIEHTTSRFDFILSTVHADLNWGAITQLLRPGGKLCFVGLPRGDLTISARLLISGNRTVCGSGTGSRTLMREMLQLAASHQIRPRIELFPMDDLNRAIARLRAKEARYRIVLWNQRT